MSSFALTRSFNSRKLRTRNYYYAAFEKDNEWQETAITSEKKIEKYCVKRLKILVLKRKHRLPNAGKKNIYLKKTAVKNKSQSSCTEIQQGSCVINITTQQGLNGNSPPLHPPTPPKDPKPSTGGGGGSSSPCVTVRWWPFSPALHSLSLYILWTGLRPSMWKQVARMEAVASQSRSRP